MQRYIVTPELLNAWQDYTNDRDLSDQFRLILSRSPEVRPYCSIVGLIKAAAYNPMDYETIRWIQEIMNIVNGGTWEVPGSGSFLIDPETKISFRIYIDVCTGPVAHIIKPVNKWTPGMMSKNTQSAMLKSAFPEVKAVKYILLAQDKSVYTENYSIQDIPDIKPILSEFFDWIKGTDLFPLYQRKWRVL